LIPPLTSRTNSFAKRSGFWFSGFLIALSFVSMLIPLAAYHVAQVAAAVRFRTAAALLLGVASLVFIFGVVLRSDAFMAGGLAAFFWSPFLLGMVYFRSRAAHRFWGVALALAPLGLGLGVVLSTPVSLLTPETLKNKIDQTFSQMMPLSEGQGSSPKSLEMAKAKEESRNQLLQEAEKFSKSAEFELLASVLSKDVSQRIFWLVFGKGGGLLFYTSLICLINLLLVDIAQTQVARYRSLVHYVLSKRSSFSSEIFSRLQAQVVTAWISGSAPNSKEASVEGFKKLVEAKTTSVGKFPKVAEAFSQIWTKKQGPQFSHFWGLQFEFGRGPWDLKSRSLPLWLSLGSVAWIVLAVWLNPEHFALSSNGIKPELTVFFQGWSTLAGDFAAWTSLAAFFLLTCLSVQGLLVVYARLSPLTLMLVVFLMMVLGPLFALNPFLGFAALGSLGLLDEAFDLRGSRAWNASAPLA
jgi:hypothetical protein